MEKLTHKLIESCEVLGYFDTELETWVLEVGKFIISMEQIDGHGFLSYLLWILAMGLELKITIIMIHRTLPNMVARLK